MFKANLSRFAKLRDSKPRVELEVLRKMQDYFPLPAEEHPLDPSYEPSLKPHHAEHEKVFADLQKLRDAGLVEPVDETHMFFAAVNSKACQLTTLGKYYWRLLDNDRI